MQKEKESGTPEQDTQAQKPKAKSGKVWKALLRLVIKIAVIAGLLAAVWTYVGEFFVLHNNSMYPNVKDGALVITYKQVVYNREDVVLYEVFGIRQLARIIGLPGDVIEITGDGTYTINGNIPYEAITEKTYPVDSNVEYPYKLKPNEYFLMNDMRDVSNDSRLFGGITNRLLHGKVVFMIQYRGI